MYYKHIYALDADVMILTYLRDYYHEDTPQGAKDAIYNSDIGFYIDDLDNEFEFFLKNPTGIYKDTLINDIPSSIFNTCYSNEFANIHPFFNKYDTPIGIS